jgi:hypothetical protein
MSGQSPNGSMKADCSNLASLSPPVANIAFGYTGAVPGTDDPFPDANCGQVDGQGCVYPAPNAATGPLGAPTITYHLDAKYRPDPATHMAAWRSYNADTGNGPARDGGASDPTGGRDCAHPTIGGVDLAEFATSTDEYATRHNPFMCFDSTVDNTPECDANVVPLGEPAAGGTPDPSGCLAWDLAQGSGDAALAQRRRPSVLRSYETCSASSPVAETVLTR